MVHDGLEAEYVAVESLDRPEVARGDVGDDPLGDQGPGPALGSDLP
jgi:hypothetical protein